jgi:hypothetical protein
MPRITGAKQHAARVNRLAGPEMVRQVGAALFAAGKIIQTEAQISITTGAVSGKSHVASLPGEPPKNDTGLLADSIETTSVGPLLVEVSSNAPYAASLEYGSAREAGKTSRSFAGKTTAYGPNKVKQGPVLIEFGSSKVAARPYMAPAAAKKRKEVVDLIQRAVKKIVAGGKVVP